MLTPHQKVAALEALDKVIRENNTWDDFRALGAYEDLWEIAHGDACRAVQVVEAARAVVAEDEKC